MTKLKILCSAIIIVAVTAWVLLERRTQVKFRENEAVLRQQDHQFAGLAAENQRLYQRLSDLIAQTKTNRAPADDRTAELAQLRAKVEALRNQANQLAKRMAENRRLTGAQFLSMGQTNIPGHNHVMASTLTMEGNPSETGKLNDATALTAALRRYTDEHQGEFPLNLNQVAPYLPKASGADSPPTANASLTGTNDFEVVFQGSQNDLTNIPVLTVALIRERQPWETPDGKWARTYGYADGAVIIESDDNFQSWDAQHIIPPQAADQ
jgi:hypothetical protein